MKKYSLLFLFLSVSVVLAAQARLGIISDSVRISDGELIIRNKTKDTAGFLYNAGNGLTIFKKVDSISRYQATLTKAELVIAIDNHALTAGMYYRVLGVSPTLYGGTDIIVQAESDNSISILGSGLFYNPKYQVYQTYNQNNIYTSGDTVTWGGYVWVNKRGLAGNSPDAFALNAEDWQGIPYDTIRYVSSWDDIRYNYYKDLIFYRKDNLNNQVSYASSSQSPDHFPTSPIRAFKWGANNIYNNTVSGSYAEFINIDTSSRVNGNTITSDSYFGANLFANCYLTGNILERATRIEHNVFINADISFNSLIGGSMAGNTVTGKPAYDFVGGAGIMYNDMHEAKIDSNTLILGEDSIARIINNSGLGDIVNCFITGGQIANNMLASGSIEHDTLTAGEGIAHNFISGIESSIAKCNLGISAGIIGNHIVSAKISKSMYGVTNCSIRSYNLEPTEIINGKTFMGGDDLSLVISGFAINKRLTSDNSGNGVWSYSSTLLGGKSLTSSITYQTTTGVGTTGADHIFKIGNNGATVAMRIQNNGNVGIGSLPVAKLHLLRTSEQLRIGFDGTNYANLVVASTGNATFGATGTASGITFNAPTFTIKQGSLDRLSFNSDSSTAGMIRILGGSDTTSGGIGLNLGSGGYTGASGTQYATAVLPTISQGDIAGYNSLLISPRETSFGSGLKNLLDVGKNTGTTPATHSSLLRIDNTGKIIITATNSTTGSTGAKTINKPAGSVNFAKAAQTLVVTNSTVSVSSMILLTIEADDTAAKSAFISSKSAGSFTIKLNAPAAAETKVNFLVLN